MWPSFSDAMLRQRGHLLLWAPVALGVGIGTYFALPVEPLPRHLIALGGTSVALGLLGRFAGNALAPLVWALALAALGVTLAGAKARSVAAPVLEGRYYGPIIGAVEMIDRSASGALRLTLRDVSLPRWTRAPPPRKVRVSLHGEQGWFIPAPGQRVMMTGHLSPPGGPVEPGGFDFRRHAWFAQLGGVGYTRTPALLLEAAPDGGLEPLRYAIARSIEGRIGGAEGAFAAALTTGVRANLPEQDIEALRRSNLAHLLAISGLHMGLLTGFVLVCLRGGLALVPFIALRWPLHKIAAVGAIIAGAIYLALSGGAVATERAFIMVCVALIAVLLDRRALTLRAVALAALIVLVLSPQALPGPGFQMSFAATSALVLVFAQLRRRSWLRGTRGAVASVMLSSLVAGLATAPFGMAHFNQLSHYGLLANLVAVPVMGSIVMPSAVIAALAAPLGLEALPLKAMELGLRWILWVARGVSDLPGAASHVVRPNGFALPLLTMGALWLGLWQGRARILGLALAGVAVVLWVNTQRPPLLIAETGGAAGLMTAEGRSLTRPRGDGFATSLWLENDGAPVDQQTAAERPGWQRNARTMRADLAGYNILAVRGKTALAEIDGCGGADLLFANAAIGPRPCTAYGPSALEREGALAVWPTGSGLKVVSAREKSGSRLWNTPQLRAVR